jgi:hypothetical protein
MPLFEPKDFGKLASHAVEGFNRPIPALCHRADQLKSPVPLGGLATGYFELRADGTLGLSSIHNSYVPMMTLSGTLLTFKGKPLNAQNADVTVLPHFPRA